MHFGFKFGSLSENNLTVTNIINVSDGQNLTYDLNVTVSDGKDNVTYNLRVIIQDRANDSLLTYTVNIASSIDSNETLNGSIILSDSDGLTSNNYTFEILDQNDSNNSVYTGNMVDVSSDGNYTFSIDLNASSIAPSHYAFVTQSISPVVGGENPQNDIVITHNFEVTYLAPIANNATIDAGWNDTVSFDMDTIISDYTDTDAQLTITIVSDPTHGNLTWNGHEFTYEVIEGSGYGGNDNFTYKITNTHNKQSEVKTITIVNILDT